ncbi:unnamed protein product [Ixodes pacificus]
MKVASVVGLGDEASRRSALDCGDALMGASFALASREGGPADLNNRLLVRLGLLKAAAERGLGKQGEASADAGPVPGVELEAPQTRLSFTPAAQERTGHAAPSSATHHSPINFLRHCPLNELFVRCGSSEDNFNYCRFHAICLVARLTEQQRSGSPSLV